MHHLQSSWDEAAASSKIRLIRRPEGEPSLLQGVASLLLVGVLYVALAVIL